MIFYYEGRAWTNSEPDSCDLTKEVKILFRIPLETIEWVPYEPAAYHWSVGWIAVDEYDQEFFIEHSDLMDYQGKCPDCCVRHTEGCPLDQMEEQ